MRVKGSCNWGMRRPSLSKVGVTRPQLGPKVLAGNALLSLDHQRFGDDLGMIVTTNGQDKEGLFKKGDELVRIEEARLETVYNRVQLPIAQGGAKDRSGGPACIGGPRHGLHPFGIGALGKYACGRGHDRAPGWRASGLRAEYLNQPDEDCK